jgi:hypothetical protein
MITTGTKLTQCLTGTRNSELNHLNLTKIKFFLSKDSNSLKRSNIIYLTNIFLNFQKKI